nr:lipase family protein [uncultured Psychroserpens sp.]
MSTVDLSCKLLCASESAYLIETSYPSGVYQIDLLNPVGLPPSIPRPLIAPNIANQYHAMGLVENPYIAVADDKIDACLIGKTETEIIVAFRGTLPPAWNLFSILDWIQDIFLVAPVAHRGITGKVHHGFLHAVTNLALNIKSAIHLLNPSGSMPIVMTGHSKGGGMAPIAAMFFKQNFNIHVEQTITFAGPKPGDAEFCNAYNAEFHNDIRYENYLDIVPLLPPSDEFIEALLLLPLPNSFKVLLKEALAWDYETVGSLRYIDSHGNVSAAPPMLERIADITYYLFADIYKIASAHHASCGFRYMQGACQGNVCKF